MNPTLRKNKAAIESGFSGSFQNPELMKIFDCVMIT